MVGCGGIGVTAGRIGVWLEFPSGAKRGNARLPYHFYSDVGQKVKRERGYLKAANRQMSENEINSQCNVTPAYTCGTDLTVPTYAFCLLYHGFQ